MTDDETAEDPLLLERIRSGEVDALGLLIDQQRERLTAFVRRIAGDALLSVIEPDDIVQEASAGAIASLHQVASADLDPLAWLFGLLRRRVIDAHRYHFAASRRSAARQRSMDAAFGDGDGQAFGDLLAASMTTPSAALSRNLKIVRVRQAIDQLPEDKRAIIRWRFVEGLSTKEIAERTGKTDAAIRVTLTRTMKKLEEILESP